ncbi:MAG: DUF4388 domain-containing protein, partial [Candidatus Aminicenantes bacterium]|nr:DUF4388 domain-containing protein [Candidatus Aminicenantes bacterium]
MDMNKGSLNRIPIVKLLITIFEQNSSGVLYLKKEGPESALKVLYFNRGKFYAAISNADVDRLENILLAKKLLDEKTLNQVNEEEHISESKGKILVEKGMITLEDLIESTKEQFRNIVMSILKWNEGRFQFVEESPPDALLNLDINILNFVFNYITQALDVEYIENQIGSMELMLSRNPDAEKLNKYNLNDKQKTLLSRFNGEATIDDILASYPEELQGSILKIIYFFFLSELILKIEPKPVQKTILVEDRDRKVSADPKKIPPKDAFVFGKKQKAKPDEVPPRAKAPFYMPEKRVDEKKKSKQFSYIIIFIILIFILGGMIFILLMDDEAPDKKPDRSTLKDVSTVTEKEPKAATDKDQPIVVKMQKTNVNEQNADMDQPKPEEKKPESKVTPPRQTLKESVSQAVKPTHKPKIEKAAMAYFKDGDFYEACDAWKKELKRSGISHSILLELDCQKESVLNAYNRIDRKDQFFILKRDLGNRICYLVFWGRFMSGQEATDSLNLVDQYFWGQSNPPKVMSLD